MIGHLEEQVRDRNALAIDALAEYENDIFTYKDELDKCRAELAKCREELKVKEMMMASLCGDSTEKQSPKRRKIDINNNDDCIIIEDDLDGNSKLFFIEIKLF